MDERYGVNLGKTEIREGYGAGDVERILRVYSDGYGDLSDGMPSFGGADAKAVLRARLTAMFRENEVELVPITMDVVILGEAAVAYGWYELTLRPRSGAGATMRRTRYMEMWRREADGVWRIGLFLDNLDQKPMFAGEMVRMLLGDAVGGPG